MTYLSQPAMQSGKTIWNGRVMLNSRSILIMARWILIIGAVSLLSGGTRLFRRALDGGLPAWHLAWILPVAVVLGAGKARMVMRRRMRINIARLEATTGKLWPWQIYPPQMLAFILTMVVLMAVMKRVLANNAMGLGALGGVDLAVAVALVVASLEYRKTAGGPKSGDQPR